MKLNLYHILNIIDVKHNCKFTDFIEHLKCLKIHFNFCDINEEEVLNYLKVLDEYKVISLEYKSPKENAEPILYILLKNLPPKWIDRSPIKRQPSIEETILVPGL